MMTNWDAWAKTDPMWAILTDPAKKGGQWNAEEFLRSGRTFVDDRMAWLRQQGIAFAANARVLDFGCGLGRLTQALSRHFVEAHGVDISSEMVARARELNQQTGKVFFHHNPNEDLRLFQDGEFDLVFSYIVLQHIPARFQKRYVAEFLRVLKPGGVALFQCVHAVGWRAWLPDAIVDWWRRRRSQGNPIIPMYGLPKRDLLNLCREAGGLILHQKAHHSAEAPRFISAEYLLRKNLP